MGQPTADEARTRAFLRHLLHGEQRRGGKDIWGGFRAGLITEIEARDAVMANFATWLSRENGVSEPPSDTWNSPELEHGFEVALFGRAASRGEV